MWMSSKADLARADQLLEGYIDHDNRADDAHSQKSDRLSEILNIQDLVQQSGLPPAEARKQIAHNVILCG